MLSENMKNYNLVQFFKVHSVTFRPNIVTSGLVNQPHLLTLGLVGRDE